MSDESANLLSCPFCNTTHHLEIEVVSQVDKQKLNILGKVSRRARISHRVTCYHCGASGPASMCSAWGVDGDLTDTSIRESTVEAVFAWNARTPISDDAFKLVSNLITSAIQQFEVHRSRDGSSGN